MASLTHPGGESENRANLSKKTKFNINKKENAFHKKFFFILLIAFLIAALSVAAFLGCLSLNIYSENPKKIASANKGESYAAGMAPLYGINPPLPTQNPAGIEDGGYLSDTPAPQVKNDIAGHKPISPLIVSGAVFECLPQRGFIYYNQRWSDYAFYPYGDMTIGDYGCGPVNVAMVVSTLTGKSVNPVEVAALCEKWGLFVKGVGTSHALFEKAAGYYDLTCRSITPTQSEVLERLAKGEFIICSVGQGYFSKGGHFLTLRGVAPGGKVYIADSYSEENTNKVWDISFIFSQLKYSHMWAFGE
ncbi:MAG: C39 family peptidase [Eubacteriales bacterium]